MTSGFRWVSGCVFCLVSAALAADARTDPPVSAAPAATANGPTTSPLEAVEPDTTEDVPSRSTDEVTMALYRARIRMNKGYFEQADSLARARIEEFGTTYGERSVAVARGITLLLENMWRSGETHGTDGREQAARGISILEEAEGPKSVELSALLAQYASFLHQDGAIAEAESTYVRAVAMRESFDGPDAVAVGKILNSLGNLYVVEGKLPEAEAAMKRVVDIYRTHFGEEAKSLGVAYNNLAAIAGKAGRPQEAKAYFEKSLANREKRLGPMHIDVARTLFNLGGLNYDLGNLAEAEAQYLRGIDIQVSYAKGDKPFIAPAFENMANIYAAQEKYAEAQAMLERAIAARETEAAENDPGLAAATNGLGRLLWKAGHRADAGTQLERAYAMRVRVHGENDPRVSAPLANLPFVRPAEPGPTLAVPRSTSSIIVAVRMPEGVTAKSSIEIVGPDGAVVARRTLNLESVDRPAAFVIVDAPAPLPQGEYEVKLHVNAKDQVRSAFRLVAASS